MIELRKYGKEPYRAAVLHGGPGALGGMAPVARELSSICGILEPLMSSPSLAGQLDDLRDTLAEHGELPFILMGHSWGAMLAFIFTAKNPSFVKKLVLISSGLYTEEHVPKLMEKRLDRLNDEERLEVHTIREAMHDPFQKDKNLLLARFGKLMTKADSYDPLPFGNEIIAYQYDVFEQVWQEARELRKSGKLLELGKLIHCPVIAFHGDYDPHPVEGIAAPLSRILKNFRFIPLYNCGHVPWIERAARQYLFQLLKNELALPSP